MEDILAWLHPEVWLPLTALTVGVGLVLFIVRGLILGLLKPRLRAPTFQTVRKAFSYGVFVVVALVVFDGLGLNLNALLGAAGIVGIAVGFAAQTVISNVLSGLFLLWEKPFEVGEVVTVDGTTGIIASVDLLSVKIRTFDNTLVRLPNETMFRSKVVNVTRFPIRRLDVELAFAHGTDLGAALELIRTVVGANRFALANPEPLLQVLELGRTAVKVGLGVWFEKADLVELRNSLLVELAGAFGDAGIDLHVPEAVIAGSRSAGQSPP